MIINGCTGSVATMLIVAFSVSLFKQDPSGTASAYLEPPMLLGVACMGITGGLFLKYFSSITIGMGCPLIITTMLCTLVFISNITPLIGYTTLFIFTFFVSLEHANGLDMMNKFLNNQSKPFFLSSFQTYLQAFHVIAPLLSSFILTSFGQNFLFIFCAIIYSLRIFPWVFIRSTNSTLNNKQSTTSTFIGFKELLYDRHIRNMTAYRIVNNIAIVGYTTALHIFIANIAYNNTQSFAIIYSKSLSITNFGIILMGIIGSYLLKKTPAYVLFFLKVAPFFTVSACIIAFYASNPYVIFITSLMHGIGAYFLKTSSLIIGQALTKTTIFTQVVLAGDATMKIVAYGIGLLVPILVNAPPIGGSIPPFIVCSLSTFFSIPMQKENSIQYLSVLARGENKNRLSKFE